MTGSIDAVVIEGFTKGLLAASYDNPKPIPPFHKEMWDLCCSDAPKVAIAAPRGHAKSTAITHAFLMAMMLFRIKRFCLLVSDTESQAAGFLVDIKAEIESNEVLRKTFEIKKIVKDTETNIIVQFNDGGKFRIQAKGSEQKVRGIKWMNMRPDLIVGDDLENDEIVMNPDRREKFRKWLMNALIPCGSDTCLIRFVGTILHLDSALQRLLEDKTWKTLFYEAEDGKFENVLWPEKFSAETLRAIYESYAAQGNTAGYAQEYRNQPVAIENAFFNPDYFYDFERDADGNWIKPNLEYFAASDFAISEREKADWNVQGVCGMSPEGILHLVDVKRFKGDSDLIIEELMATQKHWKPNMFTFETAQIDKALGPFLDREMMRQKTYLNINLITPSKSKKTRCASIQAMHKAGAIRYDKEASWWPAFYAEVMMMSESGPRGRNDDQIDVFAYLGLTVDQFYEAQSDEELEDEEYDLVMEQYYGEGANITTGY